MSGSTTPGAGRDGVVPADAAPVRVRVPGKINLYLSVGDLKDDGYHDLVTVFHAVDLVDELVITPARRDSVKTLGAVGVPAGVRNLAGVAARELRRASRAGTPVAITIDKQIPVAGGMAGGSADAAAALVGCAMLWGLDVGRDGLAEIAAGIGSDVPFALTGGTALGTGRGHRIAPVLTRVTLHWVLAMGDGGLATPEVYAELDRLRAAGRARPIGAASRMLAALAGGDVDQVAAALGNDLQPAAVSLLPSLRGTLRAGIDAGALGGVVSGSGPTVALLCRSDEHARDVAARMAGSGTCRAVRVARGPVPGARVVAAGGPAGR